MKLKSNSAGCDILENSIKVVSIVGPTASGKTKLAVKLAKKFDGVSYEQIMKINGFTKKSKIYPGNKIKIKKDMHL